MTDLFPAFEKTVIVAIGHRARQGKDVAARAIMQALPHVNIERFAFGDIIRTLARCNHGMTTKDGSLLQRVGDEARAVDPFVFLRALYWNIHERQPEVAIITDMRTDHEWDFVQALGGYTIKVERRNKAGELFVPNDRDPNHPTEIALADRDDWNAQLTNHEGRMDEFAMKALAAFCALTGHFTETRRIA